LLTFLQAAETIGLNGREVNKHVLAVLAADESITLGVVKPLYCSCFHDVAVFLCVEIALSFAGLLQAGHAGAGLLVAAVPLNQTQLHSTLDGQERPVFGALALLNKSQVFE
jgi:hypothetical protein